jgi:N-acetyltransferase
MHILPTEDRHTFSMADLPSAPTPSTNISSTPIPSDNAIFSDDFNASSPPSSPPEFPWENGSSTKYGTPSKNSPPVVSAFSVLGKRKVLATTNDNARLNKRPTPAATKKDDKPLTQMQISLGQEVQKKCKACGMEYIASSSEDRQLHDKYHKQNLEGYDVGKDFLSKGRPDGVFKTSRKGDDIATVDAHDNIWRRKRARAALDVVQRELGAVDIPDKQLWDKDTERAMSSAGASRHTMYMYVRQSKCIGLLLVEQITEGKKVLEPVKPPSAKATPTTAKTSALERLRARRALQEETEVPDQPIRIATVSSPAKLGISRIWTSPSHRGQGIAKALLDQALQHYNERVTMPNSAISTDAGEVKPRGSPPASNRELEPMTKDQVAFSQPTDAGARLARKWTGKKYGWLVYID